MVPKINNKRKQEEEEEEVYEEEDDQLDEEDAEDYDGEDGGDDDEEQGEDEEDGEDGPSDKKKQKSDKEKTPRKTRAEKREEKLVKKSKFDTSYETVYQAKLIWEQLKRVNLKKEEREPLAAQLFEKIQGKIKEIVVKHDGSRVVQTLLKYGNDQQRKQIYKELSGEEMRLSASQYGRFLVLKMLKYGNKEQRNAIISAFYGSIVKLVSNRESAQIVEYIYSELADKIQKTSIIEEFYSDEYKLFKSKEARTLEQLLAAHPNKKESIIKNLSKILTKLLSTKGKGDMLVQYTLIQRLLVIFFEYSTPQNSIDMAETLSEIVLPMVHTKDGALAAYYAVSYGSAKTRKTIIKSLKGFVEKVANEEHSCLPLIRILDVTDDTLYVTKALLGELLPKLPELASSKYGHLWILHILQPYSPRYFSQYQIGLMKPNLKNVDGVETPVGKKTQELRRKELLDFVSPKLIDLCSNYTEQMFSSMWGARVLNLTLKEATGNKIILTNRILDQITSNVELLKQHGPNVQTLFKNDYIKNSDFAVNMFAKVKDNIIEYSKLQDNNLAYVLKDMIFNLPEAQQKEADAIIKKNNLKNLVRAPPKQKKITK
ncbi:Pumilio RNA-binding region-containing protein [Heterostelium album PN500]|uniref:Pumilio RNA-binding region-containing protein n=1 Tax=Heterostelium pallidum (strain ATCC 26659 / Pp 5 / PN500) TaxID=670386 RepID=D3B734_HETP5|nr:Pumilio RNA-binding region-containing protein [Heterostelium album PN500]EFA82577.1 Pumilio RNA-binding region-containing protein [Heterostelium album PN500]|eukprot:XP_020434694.1 Pumilio RNA-binding region-containing protein [Heterostelium album PN500]